MCLKTHVDGTAYLFTNISGASCAASPPAKESSFKFNHATAVFKVTGQSSIEIFATKNKVVYVSPTMHISNKLTRAK